MLFVQCFLTGTVLSWYIHLNDTYKQDWHASLQAFIKQFSSQKNACYAQVEALNLVKKDNETVRHFALKNQQLVETGWCNEKASTINPKCNEIFTKGLPKNLKHFANKRQVKATSTVLEPSIPKINIQFFTLQFKHQCPVHPNYTKFTSLLFRDYPYSSYIYRINSKTQKRLKHNSSKIAHFPIKNIITCILRLQHKPISFTTVPHTYFSTKFRTTFNFIEIFTDDKTDTCATIIQNSTNHVPTLPTGHIGYIEFPITN